MAIDTEAIQDEMADLRHIAHRLESEEFDEDDLKELACEVRAVIGEIESAIEPSLGQYFAHQATPFQIWNDKLKPVFERFIDEHHPELLLDFRAFAEGAEQADLW